MSKFATIDVVIPFHRNDHFLNQAIDSIKKQVGCKIHLILVDDRTDASALQLDLPADTKIVRTYGVGYQLALKIGLDQCREQFVAFQDSDDISYPTRLSMQLKKLIEDQLDLVFCNMVRINKYGKKSRVFQPTPLSSKSAKEALLLGSYGADSTWLLRSDKLSDFFQFSFRSIDWATALVNFPKIRIGSINQELYFYRRHPDQITNQPEYYREAFTEIYPLWLKLNSSLGLPQLNKVDAATISFPFGGSKWNSDIQKWAIAFLERIAPLGGHEVVRFEAIFGQRALQSGFNNGVNKEILHSRKYIQAFLGYQIRTHPSG